LSQELSLPLPWVELLDCASNALLSKKDMKAFERYLLALHTTKYYNNEL